MGVYIHLSCLVMVSLWKRLQSLSSSSCTSVFSARHFKAKTNIGEMTGEAQTSDVSHECLVFLVCLFEVESFPI